MAKGVMIEMVDGKSVALLSLTEADLPKVKLAKNAKGEPSLAMKCELEGEPDEHGVVMQRRLFKWGPMPKLVMYSLPIPTTTESAEAVMGGESAVLAYAIGNYTVEQDKSHNGMEPKGSATPAAKALGKVEKANPELGRLYQEFIEATGRNASKAELDGITRRIIEATR